MPHVNINNSNGPASFHYTISTPTSTSASDIDRSLPTLLFLHPVYFAQCIFQQQFADPDLRKYNLVAIDNRLHGETSGIVPPHWRRREAAEDALSFMEALDLPRCHFIGLSMGSFVSLAVATAAPEKVLSLTLISPLAIHEPESVLEGRQQIFDYWTEAFKNAEDIDNTLVLDAAFGGMQLGFSETKTPLVKALETLAVRQAMKNFSPPNFEQSRTVCLTFFKEKTPYTDETLKKIKCPIQLIHCGQDVAYPLRCTAAIRDRLKSVGLDVRLAQVPDAPRFGVVTHPTEINALICNFIREQENADIPRAPINVRSPFEETLVAAGWREDSPIQEL